jgi:hypothetical protein
LRSVIHQSILFNLVFATTIGSMPACWLCNQFTPSLWCVYLHKMLARFAQVHTCSRTQKILEGHVLLMMFVDVCLEKLQAMTNNNDCTTLLYRDNDTKPTGFCKLACRVSDWHTRPRGKGRCYRSIDPAQRIPKSAVPTKRSSDRSLASHPTLHDTQNENISLSLHGKCKVLFIRMGTVFCTTHNTCFY